MPYADTPGDIMSVKERIRLTKEQRADMVAAVKKYFKEERGEEVGDLGAGLILDFVIERLAPEFYNQGIEDASKYMGDRIEDMLTVQIIRPR